MVSEVTDFGCVVTHRSSISSLLRKIPLFNRLESTSGSRLNPENESVSEVSDALPFSEHPSFESVCSVRLDDNVTCTGFARGRTETGGGIFTDEGCSRIFTGVV